MAGVDDLCYWCLRRSRCRLGVICTGIRQPLCRTCLDWLANRVDNPEGLPPQPDGRTKTTQYLERLIGGQLPNGIPWRSVADFLRYDIEPGNRGFITGVRGYRLRGHFPLITKDLRKLPRPYAPLCFPPNGADNQREATHTPDGWYIPPHLRWRVARSSEATHTLDGRYIDQWAARGWTTWQWNEGWQPRGSDTDQFGVRDAWAWHQWEGRCTTGWQPRTSDTWWWRSRYTRGWQPRSSDTWWWISRDNWGWQPRSSDIHQR